MLPKLELLLKCGAILLSLSLAERAHSQTADCHDALVLNTTVENTDLAQKISILKTVDENTFNEARKEFSAEGEYLGNIFVTGEMNYAEFDRKRQRFLSEYRFNLNQSETRAFSEVYLSDNARKAYTECLQSLPVLGTRVWTLNASPDDPIVSVRISFVTSGEDTTHRNVNLNAVGIGSEVLASKEMLEIMKDFVGSRTFDISLRRNINQTTILNINIIPSSNAGSASITIPRTPIIQKKGWEYKPDRVTTIYDTPTYDGVEKQYPQRVCIPSAPADSEWMGEDGELVAATSSTRAEPLGEAHGDQRIEETPSAANIQKQGLCFDGNVGTDKTATGHQVRFTVSAIARRPKWVSCRTEDAAASSDTVSCP